MKNIKKLTGIMMAGALAFSVPVPAIASGFDTSSLEALIDSGVDAVFSDPDQTVDIIMYVKDKIGQQDVTDDQIRTVINEAAECFPDQSYRFREGQSGRPCQKGKGCQY